VFRLGHSRSDCPQMVDKFVKSRLRDERQCRPTLKIDAKRWPVPVSNRGEKGDRMARSGKRDSKDWKHVKKTNMVDGWDDLGRENTRSKLSTDCLHLDVRSLCDVET